jgi:hypothetical protein
METIKTIKVSIVLHVILKMEDCYNRVLKAAHDLFMKYGIRSVSMDDIARNLGISKKTIYSCFTEKDEIVLKVNHLMQEKWEQEADSIRNTSSNAIELMVRLSLMLRSHISSMNPSILFDLYKFHRTAWEDWNKYKTENVRKKLMDVMDRGISEGLFRSDINKEILSTLRVEQIELAFNDSIFPHEQYNLELVQMQLADHFIQGLLTEKGAAYYLQTKSKLFETKNN